MRLRRYRPAAVMLLGLHLSACHTWEPVLSISPRRFIEEGLPPAVRVVLADGTEVVRNPRVANDSIFSAVPGCQVSSVRAGPSQACRVPRTEQLSLSDVRSLEIQRTHVGRSIAAIGIPLVAVTFLIAGLAWR